MGIVKTLNGRMKGREKETLKNPTLIGQSMDACREFMMRLVWGKSQGQLRDSWTPEPPSAKASIVWRISGDAVGALVPSARS